jgi:hypothetical protein
MGELKPELKRSVLGELQGMERLDEERAGVVLADA